MLHKDCYRKGSIEKNLVVSRKELDAKTNCLVVNLQSLSVVKRRLEGWYEIVAGVGITQLEQ
jgi:hypothetical protein